MPCAPELPDFAEGVHGAGMPAAVAPCCRGQLSPPSFSDPVDFGSLILKRGLVRAASEECWEWPSKAQSRCAPPALVGADVLCLAGAGAGKTSTMALVCLELLEASARSHRGGPEVLVLCPTREQVLEAVGLFERLGTYLEDVTVGTVCGGPRWHAADRKVLRTGSTPRVLIGTPGRVRALLRDGTLSLEGLRRVAVDSCEACLGGAGTKDLSLLHDVRAILAEAARCDAQLLLFGAPMPPAAARQLLILGAAAPRARDLHEVVLPFGESILENSPVKRYAACVDYEGLEDRLNSQLLLNVWQGPQQVVPMLGDYDTEDSSMESSGNSPAADLDAEAEVRITDEVLLLGCANAPHAALEVEVVEALEVEERPVECALEESLVQGCANAPADFEVEGRPVERDREESRLQGCASAPGDLEVAEVAADEAPVQGCANAPLATFEKDVPEEADAMEEERPVQGCANAPSATAEEPMPGCANAPPAAAELETAEEEPVQGCANAAAAAVEVESAEAPTCPKPPAGVAVCRLWPAAATVPSKGCKGLEEQRRRAVVGLMDVLDFTQALVFASCPDRAEELLEVLAESGLSCLLVHEGQPEAERVENCSRFRDFENRVLVATDAGICITNEALGQRVNALVNYDAPEDAQQYARRVAAAHGAGASPTDVAVTITAADQEKEGLRIVEQPLGVNCTAAEQDEEVLHHLGHRMRGVPDQRPRPCGGTVPMDVAMAVEASEEESLSRPARRRRLC